MKTTWHCRTSHPQQSATTDFTGTARVTRSIGRAMPGYRVNIAVEFWLGGRRVATTTTGFTPR